jgi:uncharacterized protein
MLAHDAASHKPTARQARTTVASKRSHLGAFAPLAVSGTALLTTFRRSGEAVSTPVSVALGDGRAYFVTAADSGKAKRLARDPNLTLAPCTRRGRVLGATVRGRARLLEGEERRRAHGLLRPTAPLWWSYLLYRLRGKTMRLYEVTPAQPDRRTAYGPRGGRWVRSTKGDLQDARLLQSPPSGHGRVLPLPRYGARARITKRFWLGSTAGPVEHLKTGCVTSTSSGR